MYIAYHCITIADVFNHRFHCHPKAMFFATPTKDHESSLNWPRTWWTHDGCSQRITHAIAPRKSSTQGQWNTIVIIVFHLQAIRIKPAPIQAQQQELSEVMGVPIFLVCPFHPFFLAFFFHKKQHSRAEGRFFPMTYGSLESSTESRGPAGFHPWPRRSCTCGGRWGRCARSGPSSARALEYLEYGKVPIYKWPKCGYNHGTLQNSNWEWSSFSKGCHSIFRPVDASCLGSCPSVALCILCALTTNGELLPFCCILGTAPQFLSPTLQTMGCRSTVDCTLCKMTHSKQWLSFPQASIAWKILGV